ncbi:hypothetical protein BCV71DRAFT_245575 [Rhizopus microsporus]|uniref:Uncharacterized protein n=1 Tax=Rhizopus microsporus TaxID=58291 RepID=A0A1X0RS52_RHIZD|nr:hypothetical protein BCV71DRAFT_245575 [Rhizopus microsporus]
MLSEKRRSIVQQLSVNKNKGTIWESEIFSSVNRYHLRELVRQQGLNFITIPNKVRICNFDESVVIFIDERTVHKSDLLLHFRKAYEKDHEKFPGETYVIYADGNYIGTKGIASAAQKENRLTQTLHLKIGMPIMSTSLMIQRNDRQVSSTSYTRTKFPVVPAFASAIHKAQSTAIDCVDIHLVNMLTHRKYCVDCDAVELVKQKTHIDHRS